MSQGQQVVIGIDPDLRRVGIGAVDVETRKAVYVAVPKVFSDKTEADAVREIVPQLRGCISDVMKALGHPLCMGVVVEGQEIAYSAQQGANPRSILVLAQVAGALLCEAGYEVTKEKILFPKPIEWKGNVPKPIHQARVYNTLGWEYEQTKEYTRPTNVGPEVMGADALNKSDWKHVGDALGLALWGIEKLGRRRG